MADDGQPAPPGQPTGRRERVGAEATNRGDQLRRPFGRNLHKLTAPRHVLHDTDSPATPDHHATAFRGTPAPGRPHLVLHAEGVSSDLSSLSRLELEAIVRLVMALVAEDRPLLQEAQAFEHGMDPYLWTRDYGTHGHVDLTVPPGEPRKWSGLVIRSDEDLSWVGVVVDLWTRQEGPSDLSLEADIYHSTATTARVVLRSLRVM